jgi:small-conductance mechanosensitive channel
MDIQQATNLAIHQAFEAEAIEFAYPTQTLFIERQEG